MQLNEILTGWANVVKDKLGVLDDKTHRMALIRLSHCNSCPVRTNNTCDPNKTIKNILDERTVNGCGCNIAAKTLSPNSECPAGKW
jgi:hypothetical protein